MVFMNRLNKHEIFLTKLCFKLWIYYAFIPKCTIKLPKTFGKNLPFIIFYIDDIIFHTVGIIKLWNKKTTFN